MKILSVRNYQKHSNPKNINTAPQQSFGNYARFRIPDNLIKKSETFLDIFSITPSKKVRDAFLEAQKDIAESIKKLTDGNVNLYRRTLDGMGFREKHANCAYDTFARTLFIEDNNGKNLPELLKAIEYLTKEQKISSEVFASDLFAPKAKGFLAASNLDLRAYGATPDQMIKL